MTARWARILALAGLSRGWLAFGVVAFALSLALIAARLAGLPSSLTGFALHWALLGWVVLALAQLAAWGGQAGRIVAMVLAGTGLTVLAASYIAHFVSWAYLHTGVNVRMMSAYANHLVPVAQAGGISLPLLALSIAALVAVCAGVAWWLLRGERGKAHRSWFALAALGIGALGYAVLQPRFERYEFLHRMVTGVPLELAPQSLLSFAKPRLRPRFDAPLPDDISARPLVLITVDALRADAMEAYGNPTRNTPFLAQLVADGRMRRYDTAHSVCAFSYCGLLGIIASRTWDGMRRTPDNLADALAVLDVPSRFVMSGDHQRYYALRRQYGPNVTSYTDGSDIPGAYPNDDRLVLRRLAALEPRAPSFTWFHLMDVHNLGLRGLNKRVAIRDPELLGRMADQGEGLATYAQRYHDGIRTMDDSVRAIFGWLERTGKLDDALVILTADHGEWLGEGGRTGHGGPPYDILTRVPLLVYGKGAADWPERPLASTLDVAPTFMAALGAPVPTGFEGVPLQEATPRCAVPAASRTIGVLRGENADLWQTEPGDRVLAGRGAVEVPNANSASATRDAPDARILKRLLACR